VLLQSLCTHVPLLYGGCSPTTDQTPFREGTHHPNLSSEWTRSVPSPIPNTSFPPHSRYHVAASISTLSPASIAIIASIVHQVTSIITNHSLPISPRIAILMPRAPPTKRSRRRRRRRSARPRTIQSYRTQRPQPQPKKPKGADDDDNSNLVENWRRKTIMSIVYEGYVPKHDRVN